MKNDFTPKLFTLLKNGTVQQFIVKDILAGITVGIVALPLAIAFAIASGASPAQGLITAIVAGFVISAFGGSRVQIGGPTGAFIIIVFGITQKFGSEGLIIATFMAGILIMIFGFLRLGNLLRYIPYPLILGFTSGIAVLIFSTQINDFFGLGLTKVPADFFEKWHLYYKNLQSINPIALAISATTVLISLLFFRITKRVPGSIIAIVLSTLVVQVFELPVETIESRFGNLPSILTMPQFPQFSFEKVKDLISPAIAIALLGGIESLLSAVVSDGMIGGRHRSNIELIAQGGANVLSAFFGGIPATGAIARTATNIKNGGRTPVAGIVHALVLFLIALVFAPYAKLIPLSCLAGILVVVAYHMGEWKHFFASLKSNKLDVLVLISTFLITIIFDLIIAIEVGMVLSSFIFMKRMSDIVTINNQKINFNEMSQDGEELFEQKFLQLPEEIILYEINGPLFFGAAHKFQQTVKELHQIPKVLIIRMRKVPFIDATGIQNLKLTMQELISNRSQVILSETNAQVEQELTRTGLKKLIHAENYTPTVEKAIERGKYLLSLIEKEPRTL